MPAIYLDNNATTRLDPAARDAMLPFLDGLYGNPSSIHGFGAPARQAIDEARSRVARLIGAAYDSEVIFTAGATESNSTALLSAVAAFPERREIITTQVEHPAILEVCEHLERQGYTIHRLPVNRQGQLDLAHYASLLSPRVALVSIMWANNETGTIFPVEQLARLAANAGILFHTDAVQAVGKLPVDLASSSISLLSFSGHKLHGPKGIGVLYVKRGTRFRPLLRGGHQERGLRAGTENVAGIAGLGVASQLAQQHLAQEQTRVAALRDKLQHALLTRIPSSAVTGDPEHRTPNTLNIAFDYVEGEAVLLLLDQLGIAASSGSACTSGSLEPSHVMRAMGVPYTSAHGTIRFSLSRFTTDAEIDYVIEQLPPIIARLRALSPYWVTDKPQLASLGEFAPAYG